jgi:hypothetical protein
LDPVSLAKLSATAPLLQTAGELKTVKKPFTDADVIQKIYTFLLLGLEIFKAGLACLLVAQLVLNCGSHICTSTDLNSSTLYQTTIAWNYFTFLVLLLHYGISWSRERFLIEYFDQDPSVPNTNLDVVLEEYPSIHSYFTFFNRLSLFSGLIFLIVSIINIYLSGILSLQYYSSQSFPTLLSNLILLSSILYRSLSASLSRLAISMVQMEMIAFNQIDADHIGDKGKVAGIRPWYFYAFGISHMDKIKSD